MAESETSRDSETESKSQNASALAEDNKRLQDMLHSALRREAEALRRVKHLSELLSECGVANSGTSSSEPERMSLPHISFQVIILYLQRRRMRRWPLVWQRAAGGEEGTGGPGQFGRRQERAGRGVTVTMALHPSVRSVITVTQSNQLV